MRRAALLLIAVLIGWYEVRVIPVANYGKPLERPVLYQDQKHWMLCVPLDQTRVQCYERAEPYKFKPQNPFLPGK